MSAFTQTGRLLTLSTPLGDDVLLLTGFRGQDALAQPFVYHLSVLSERADITAQDIIGKNVTWAIHHSLTAPKFFNGYVSRFTAGGVGLYGLRSYQLEVVPWLWFLTRTADSRIFFPDVADKTAVDVLRAAFADYGFAEFDDKNLGTGYPKHEYWVQYRETAFNFVSRLMEDEGIFYFWDQADGAHTLVLGDRKHHYRACPESQVPFANGGSRAASQITAWKHEWQCRSTAVAHTDYNFETPRTNLLAGTRSVIEMTYPGAFELFDFPGEYRRKDDGLHRSNRRMEEEEAAFHVVQGGSNCSSFFAGGTFTLSEHELDEEAGQTYVLTHVEHDAFDTTYGNDGESGYTNRFQCIPAAVTFRPARRTPRPFVQGVQTAVVVGPAHDDIYTDEYGRIKVQFHWDRRGQRNEHSSCWIRVATPWAGKHWGMVHLPRIGQEVVVDFLEGDPDRPLVTGSLYNADQLPPYTLPAGKRISGAKSHSTPGGEGYNEISFDDTKGKEKITLHGQRDMATTILNNDSQTVHANRAVTVQGQLTERITGDTAITISEGDYTHSVSQGKATYTVQGELKEDYHASQTTTVAKDVTIKSKTTEITLDAAKKITLVSGASQITLEKNGTITLKCKHLVVDADTDVKAGAPLVEIIGSDKATLAGGKTGAQAVTCDAAKVALGGAMIHSEATGNHVILGTLVKIN